MSIIIAGCFSGEANREADFEGFTSLVREKENNLMVFVNDNVSLKEKRQLNTPEDAYSVAYGLKGLDRAKILDKDGQEIKFEEITHGSKVKVWVHGLYSEKRTYVKDIEEGSTYVYDLLPEYTVEKVEVQEIEKADLLPKMVSDEEGKYTVYIFFGSREYIGLEMSEREFLDTGKVQGMSVSLTPQGRKEEVFGITEYPTILIFDTEDLVFRSTDWDEAMGYFKD